MPPAKHRRRLGLALLLVLPGALVSLAAAGPAGASVLVQQVSADPLTAVPSTPPGVHHGTEVETATLAEGGTVVSSFQVGRFAAYGAMAMGWATSTDGGQTWQHGLLPGVSAASPSPDSAYVSVANQSVMYDAALGTWLIPTVAVVACSSLTPRPESCGSGGSLTEHTMLVNRSADGENWSQPVTAVPADVDKPWGVCDDTPTSPSYGTCYVAYAQIDDGDRLAVIHSTDGGLTWSAPVYTASGQDAYNAIPAVLPDGRLVVVATDLANGHSGSRLLSFVSDDGGLTLSDASTASDALPAIEYHTPAGGIRALDKPSVSVDGAGNIYVAWSDCRFRPACGANDIVYAVSPNGVDFSAPDRVGATPMSGTVDDFIPGIAVRPGTSGASAELGVVYYSFPQSSCSSATCRLDVDFSSSTDGGATWQTTQLDPTSMQLGWLAPSSLGQMVGDYEAVSYVDGHAVTVFPLAAAPTGAGLDEAENAASFPWAGGSTVLAVQGSGQVAAAGAGFGTRLQAQVLNPATGDPLAGSTVSFSATGATFPGGHSTRTATTDSAGVATAPDLVAGAGPGPASVTATVAGQPGTAQFLLTVAGAPASLKVAPGASPQSTPAGSAFAGRLAVTVDDADGSPVPGAGVTFAAPAAGPSGTFAGGDTTASVTADRAGVAVAPAFTADGATGSYQVTVSAGSASAALALANASSGPADLSVSGGSGQTAAAGQSFGSPLEVTLTDTAGVPYAGAPVTFSAPASEASATFAGTGSDTSTVTTDQAGVATVPVYAGTATGAYTVTATSGAASASLGLSNVAGAPAAVQLWLHSNHQSQPVGSQVANPLTVTVTDVNGNPVPADEVTFTAPATGPSGTFVGGANSVTVPTSPAGVAAAPALTADQFAGTYTVTATAASATGPSPSSGFTLTNTQAPAITSASTASFTLGTAGSFIVTTSGTPAPALSESGALPGGIAFADQGNGTALLSGTPTASGVYPVTVDAGNGVGAPATQKLRIKVATGLSVGGVAPSVLGPGARSVPITVTGTGFTSTATLVSSKPKVTLSAVTVDSPTSLSALVSVAAAAPPGPVTLSVKQPDGSAHCPGCLVVDPAPTLASLTPSSLAPGASSAPVTMTGSGYVAGATVTVTGPGKVTAAVTSVSPTSVALVLTVAARAAPGQYSLRLANGDEGSAVFRDCLTVAAG